jgi:hypothetical protein
MTLNNNTCLGFVLLLISVGASTETVLPKPVMIGEAGEYVDACPSLGVANPEPGKKIVVWAEPIDRSFAFGELEPGSSLYLCDDSVEGWSGVVYSTNQDEDCGVSSPIFGEEMYSGPCASGWVEKKYLKVVAG